MIHRCVSHLPPGNEVFYGKNFTIVSISPGASDWFCGYKVQNYSFCGACVSLWENSEKGGGEELRNGLGNNLRNHLKHFMHKGVPIVMIFIAMYAVVLLHPILIRVQHTTFNSLKPCHL